MIEDWNKHLLVYYDEEQALYMFCDIDKPTDRYNILFGRDNRKVIGNIYLNKKLLKNKGFLKLLNLEEI